MLTLVLALALALEAAAATKKTRKPAPAARPAVEKPIYEAPMRVVIVQNGKACGETCPQWIAAEGEITAATPALFEKVFRQMGKRKLPVLIRSPGGSIEAAFRIGRMIRKRGLDVYVGYTVYEGCTPDKKGCKLPEEQGGIYRGKAMEYYAWCNSACHLVLASGTKRLAGYGSYVGVHKPKTVWSRQIVTYRERYRIVKGKKQVIDRKIVSRKPTKSKVTFGIDPRLRKSLLAYYKAMGVDPAILAENEKAEYKDLNFLSSAKLDAYRLRTSRESVVVVLGDDICKRAAAPAYCLPPAGKPKRQTAMATQQPPAPPPAKPAVFGPVGDRYQDMTFTLLRNEDEACRPRCPAWIAARGRITVGTAERFRTFLRNHKLDPVVVVLDSPGGDGREAMKLGRLLRKAGASTLVGISAARPCDGSDPSCKPYIRPGYYNAERPLCQFECTLPFMAGKVRIVDGYSDLRFRNLELRKIEVAGQLDESTPLMNYFREMDAPDTLLRDLVSSPQPAMSGSKAVAIGAATLSPDYISTYLRGASCSSRTLLCQK